MSDPGVQVLHHKEVFQRKWHRVLQKTICLNLWVIITYVFLKGLLLRPSLLKQSTKPTLWGDFSSQLLFNPIILQFFWPNREKHVKCEEYYCISQTVAHSSRADSSGSQVLLFFLLFLFLHTFKKCLWGTAVGLPLPCSAQMILSSSHHQLLSLRRRDLSFKPQT